MPRRRGNASGGRGRGRGRGRPPGSTIRRSTSPSPEMPRRRGNASGGRGRAGRGRGRPPGSTIRRSTSPSPETIPPKRRRDEEGDIEDFSRRKRNRLGEGLEGRTNVLSDETFIKAVAALRRNKNKTHASQLKAVDVDYHTEANRDAHRTDQYETNGLIVRRGQTFDISVSFDRDFIPNQDKIILQFVVGSRPLESKHSLIRVQVVNKLSTSLWGMKINESNGKTVRLSVMSPADAKVGSYSVYIETKVKDKEGGKDFHFRTKHSEEIYILFNAWCKDDRVYMDNESYRQEYVLNDHGRIWVGSWRRQSDIPWNFGQFEEVSLDVAMWLLDNAELSPSARGNPVQVCRTMSQLANYNDKDGGVLYGRWTSDYPKNSTRPTAWTGSVSILEKFDRKKYFVRYGQCWVFSGLVTTLLRALGIPTRSVTNFASAHDNDASMTIDFHFDEDGEPLDDLNDSVWNFHVWNESFFTRPDLPGGYDGWQAHDATPQELSGGIFRCGPCPVKAIKNGEIYIPYDTGFVFAEVNGDKVYWNVDEDGAMEVDYIEKKSIGKFISTKAVGTNDREDLTLQYKYREGTPEERRAVKFANKYSSRQDQEIYKPSRPEDVEFSIDTYSEVMVGDDFEVWLTMKNNSELGRTVKLAMVAKIAFYTGITAQHLKDLSEEVHLEKGQEKTVTLKIKRDDYLKKLTSDVSINIFIRASVRETRQAFATMESIEFAKPEIEANIPFDGVSRNEDFEMTFSFTNPLPVKLTNGEFNIECSRMKPRAQQIFLKSPIGPGETASTTVTLKSAKRGTRFVESSFVSDQLGGVRGEFEVEVI